MINTEQLNRIADTDFSSFPKGEDNVKYKIVVPFLQAFKHENLEFEHATQGSLIDINIGNRIIVETKALDKNINHHVKQLSDYSGRELPVLAILTNGRHFRIYSPQWRQQRTFAEKVIYEFEIQDLKNIDLLNRLEQILGFSNYENNAFLDNVDQRERELMDATKEIQRLKNIKLAQVIELGKEINELKERAQEINDQITAKEQIVADIQSDQIPEISDVKFRVYFPENIIQPTLGSIRTPHVEKPATNYTETVGDKFKIENKNGASAFGKILPNGNFLVLAGSKVSSNTAPLFEANAPAAYKLRSGFIANGVIDGQGKFTRDVEFNSKSSAACVVLAGSINGNKVWKRM